MNGKQAKAIRRICGDNKKAARFARKRYATAGTSASQNPKFRNVSPDVATGRPGKGEPNTAAPQEKPMRAIGSIALALKCKARELVRPFVPYNCRDPIKYLSHGPRTRVNAVLQQLRAA
jgi:hypothetical protein